MNTPGTVKHYKFCNRMHTVRTGQDIFPVTSVSVNLRDRHAYNQQTYVADPRSSNLEVTVQQMNRIRLDFSSLIQTPSMLFKLE